MSESERNYLFIFQIIIAKLLKLSLNGIVTCFFFLPFLINPTDPSVDLENSREIFQIFNWIRFEESIVKKKRKRERDVTIGYVNRTIESESAACAIRFQGPAKRNLRVRGAMIRVNRLLLLFLPPCSLFFFLSSSLLNTLVNRRHALTKFPFPARAVRRFRRQ